MRATSCLPQKKALRATAENRARFETQRAQLEANNLELKKEAEAVSEKLDGKIFVAIRSAGDTGQLYGSVSTRDIAEVVTAGGFTIERRQVILERPDQDAGPARTRVALHPGGDRQGDAQRRPLRGRGRAPVARRGRDRRQGGEARARDLRPRRCSRRAPPLPRTAERPRRTKAEGGKRLKSALCCPIRAGKRFLSRMCIAGTESLDGA